MHKIRLYVVPEVREEELGKSEDVVVDEIDLPPELPPVMQRRNSRRPNSSGGGNGGVVRLNVIQKDRRNDSLVPKLKHIKQRLTINENQNNSESIVVVPVNKNLNNNNNNNGKKNNFDNNGAKNVHENLMKLQNKVDFSISRNDVALNKGVFASPRIKELAANLEQKIIERNAKLLRECIFNGADNETKKNTRDEEKEEEKEKEKGGEDETDKSNFGLFSNVNSCNGDVTPRKILRNENNCVSVSAGTPLSPIFGSPTSPDKVNSQFSITNRNSPIVGGTRISDGNDNNPFINHRLVINECKNNFIKRYCDGGDCRAQNTANNNNGNNNNNNNNSSVILRRNNKLNRYREYDLEQKIEVEIKMREGSARLLAAARHRAQSLEAARALLTSNERMSAYMAELQRRKKEPSSNKPSLPVSNARVSLSDLRVPLMWRDSDHFKNRGDYRRFAVFCLARVGTEIHDTALLCPVDRALTDVTFPDVLVFNNVPAEFELTLEIYSHILQEDLSIASTPRRIKRSIHSSISRTVGKKLAASLRDELNSGKIGPHFELMASARLTLDETDDNIHTHDLVLNNLENKNHSLPLFGHFCCRLAAQPECITKEACSGNVILDGRSCWARIQSFTLQAWDSRKLAEEEQTPCSTVPINRETLIQPSKSSSKELRISNTIDGSDKITTIRLETADEAQKWVRQLVAHAKDHLRWRHAAENIQDVPSVESARNSFISNKRQGSLYDETPLIESVQSDFNSANRPTVQEIFGLTPSTSLSSCSSTSSPPSLRSRSLSTSGVRKSGTNTLRSHWPFSNKNHD